MGDYVKWFTICFAVIISPLALADAGITYHGRLLKSDGTPVTSSSVQFQIQIRTPGSENCLLYQETQTKDLSATSGIFSLTINDGTATTPNSEPFTLSEAFRNHGTYNFGPGKCSGGTVYTPNPTDGRKIAVQFNDGSGWETLPAQDINYVPMAIEAETVAGRTPYSFLRVDDSTTSSNTTELTSANLTEFWDLLSGTSAQYVHSSTGNGANLPSLSSSPGSPSAGMIWYDSGTKKINYFDGTATQTLGTAGGSVTGITIGSGLVDGLGSSGATITTSGTIALPAVGTSGTYYKVTTDAQGRVTSGVTSLATSDLPAGTATQWVTDSPNIYYSLGNVGIGTSTPGAALEVSAASASILRLRYDSNYYTDVSTDHLNAVGTSQNFDIQTNGTSRLSVRDNGDIGIGTTVPADLLDIRGSSEVYLQVGTDGTSSSQEAGIHILTKSSGGDELGAASTKGWEIFGRPDAYSTVSQQNSLNVNYYDGSSWQEDLSIDSTGKVGIGTTEPGSMLTVNGVIESTGGGIKFPDGATQATSAFNDMLVVDEKTSGTNGGTCSSGTWFQRVLNTVRFNHIGGATLSSNQITLPAGTYYVRACSTGMGTNEFKALLYNVTGSTNLVIGTSVQSDHGSSGATVCSDIEGEFTLAVASTIELRHRCLTSESGDGLGSAVDFGVDEVYSTVYIQKR